MFSAEIEMNKKSLMPEIVFHNLMATKIKNQLFPNFIRFPRILFSFHSLIIYTAIAVRWNVLLLLLPPPWSLEIRVLSCELEELSLKLSFLVDHGQVL